MSSDGVHPGEMFEDDPTFAAFARDLRDAEAESPPPVVGATLAAVLEGRAPAESYPEVPSVPVVRRPWVRRGAVRAVIGGAVFSVAFGSLGVAGALPGPVQKQVARMAEVVGIELPGDEAPVTTIVPSTTTPAPTPAPAGTVTTPRPTTTVGGGLPAGLEPESDEPAKPGNSNGRGNGNRGEDDDREDEDDDADEREDDDADEREDDGSARPGRVTTTTTVEADDDSGRGPGEGDEDDDEDEDENADDDDVDLDSPRGPDGAVQSRRPQRP